MDLTRSAEASRFGTGMQEMLEKSVMKVKEAERPEVFQEASPTFRVHPDAPPFFVLHGANDTLVPVETARTFVRRLRATSQAPVAYAELPRAQHAFDVLASVRCQATTSAVGDFLDGARTARAAARHDGPTPARNLSDLESPPGI
jgi:acetyl esterase/lipase